MKMGSLCPSIHSQIPLAHHPHMPGAGQALKVIAGDIGAGVTASNSTRHLIELIQRFLKK